MFPVSDDKLSQSQIETVKTAITHIKDAQKVILDTLDIPFVAPGDKEDNEFMQRQGVKSLFNIIFLLDDAEKFALSLTNN